MWFHRLRQTRTSVHDESERQRQERGSLLNACRLSGSVQIAAQLLVWVPIFAYDRSEQTVWQAALMLLIPLLLLFFVWKKGAGAVGTRAGAWWTLPLVLCLMLDAALLLRVLAGYIGRLIPEYPYGLTVLAPLAACYVSVLLTRKNGASYGMWTLKWAFVFLFLTSTLLQGADGNAVRLWPLLGQGLGQTALTALMGCGGVWGVALLFLTPDGQGEKQGHPPALYAAIPLVMGVIWSLWFALTRPWRPGDGLVIGERLMGIARHSSSTVLYELTGLWWMLLLPCALIGGLTAAERLLRAVWPRLPRSLAALIPVLPAVILCVGWRDEMLSWLAVALPLRAAVSLISGAGMAVTANGRGRKE